MRQKLRRRDLPAAERRRLLDQIASRESFEQFVGKRKLANERHPKKKGRRGRRLGVGIRSV
jgi:hypothetical protein